MRFRGLPGTKHHGPRADTTEVCGVTVPEAGHLGPEGQQGGVLLTDLSENPAN